MVICQKKLFICDYGVCNCNILIIFLWAGKYITNQWHSINAQTRCMSSLSINLCRVITCFRIIFSNKMMYKRVKNEFLQYMMNVKLKISFISLSLVHEILALISWRSQWIFNSNLFHSNYTSFQIVVMCQLIYCNPWKLPHHSFISLNP